MCTPLKCFAVFFATRIFTHIRFLLHFSATNRRQRSWVEKHPCRRCFGFGLSSVSPARHFRIGINNSRDGICSAWYQFFLSNYWTLLRLRGWRYVPTAKIPVTSPRCIYSGNIGSHFSSALWCRYVSFLRSRWPNLFVTALRPTLINILSPSMVSVFSLFSNTTLLPSICTTLALS